MGAKDKCALTFDIKATEKKEGEWIENYDELYLYKQRVYHRYGTCTESIFLNWLFIKSTYSDVNLFLILLLCSPTA